MTDGTPRERMKAQLARAKALGLHPTEFNSGSTGNPANGVRLFREPSDHFDGHHLGHVDGLGQLTAFLDGYEAHAAVVAPLRGHMVAALEKASHLIAGSGIGDGGGPDGPEGLLAEIRVLTTR